MIRGSTRRLRQPNSNHFRYATRCVGTAVKTLGENLKGCWANNDERLAHRHHAVAIWKNSKPRASAAMRGSSQSARVRATGLKAHQIKNSNSVLARQAIAAQHQSQQRPLLNV